jgi:3-oxoacyl-[acyl-carrier-protein] synthase-1
MNNAFIIGSSLISSLGQNKKEAVQKVKNLSDENYQEYLNSIFKDKKYYFISNNETKKKRYINILNTTIKSAIEDSGISKDETKNLFVIIGSTSMNISMFEEHYKEEKELFDIGNGIIARYIKEYLELKEEPIIFSTACTSSANALIYGSNLIKEEKKDNILIIGIEVFNDSTLKGFNSLMLTSESGKYTPLQKESDGIVLGEACSAIVLSSKTKDSSDFKILGSSNIFDSYSNTGSNPNGETIYKTITECLKCSNLNLEDITLLNTHAPGTQSSNEAEYNALLKLDLKNVILSSLKPYIGHTLGACSLNEIVLLLACLKNGFIPTTLGIKDDEELKFSSYAEYKKKSTLLFSYNGFSGNNLSLAITNQEDN